MGHGVERHARVLTVERDRRRPRHAERSGQRRPCAMRPHCASARRGSLPYCQPMLRRGAPSRVGRATSLSPKLRLKLLPPVNRARIRRQEAFFHVASGRAPARDSLAPFDTLRASEGWEGQLEIAVLPEANDALQLRTNRYRHGNTSVVFAGELDGTGVALVKARESWRL